MGHAPHWEHVISTCSGNSFFMLKEQDADLRVPTIRWCGKSKHLSRRRRGEEPPVGAHGGRYRYQIRIVKMFHEGTSQKHCYHSDASERQLASLHLITRSEAV